MAKHQPQLPDNSPSAAYATLRAAHELESARYHSIIQSPTYIPTLAEALRLYEHSEEFAPADLVTWKPHLRAAEYPAYGAPAIVVELFENVSFETDEDDQSEPIDVVIGYLDGDEDLRMFATNSRRLMRWPNTQD